MRIAGDAARASARRHAGCQRASSASARMRAAIGLSSSSRRARRPRGPPRREARSAPGRRRGRSRRCAASRRRAAGRASASGMISKPVTRQLAGSQTGCAPISASACAMSSPPVRMFDVPQAERPSDCRILAVILEVALEQGVAPILAQASRRPASARRGCRPNRSCGPVGSTSSRPRVGAPEGPGATKRPSRPSSTRGDLARARRRAAQGGCDRVDLVEHRSRAAVQARCRRLVPTTSCAASSSRRSTVSPAVRHGIARQLARRCRPRPCPRLRHVASRADRNRRSSRSAASARISDAIAAFARSARHAGQGHQQIGFERARRAMRRGHAARRGSALPSGRRDGRRASARSLVVVAGEARDRDRGRWLRVRSRISRFERRSAARVEAWPPGNIRRSAPRAP